MASVKATASSATHGSLGSATAALKRNMPKSRVVPTVLRCPSPSSTEHTATLMTWASAVLPRPQNAADVTNQSSPSASAALLVRPLIPGSRDIAHTVMAKVALKPSCLANTETSMAAGSFSDIDCNNSTTSLKNEPR
ncbi:hypothetical protein PGT21_022585 [Puccinia graminis f. sp. tritici]|uniref:Uncharacterized protein n=1 Tax=Puccinia graminis f. sp. tritici TaxID=56615 RepID=A0A5B0QKU9_PUCGR|nr:hypothetical protein PGT21_022585 [Puccinia graminis f. sp. tritici]KAA1113723.1 hypothetical protein PGTUg99_002885 [Puccinia graminis f. sp. tritici]